MRFRELGQREDLGRHGPQELHPKDRHTVLVHGGRRLDHQGHAFGGPVPTERRTLRIDTDGFDLGQGERIVAIGPLDGQSGRRRPRRLMLEDDLAIDDLEFFRAQGL